MIKRKCLFILISLSLWLPSANLAQVYNLDFLTYSDHYNESNFSMTRSKITGIIFNGINEFKKNGEMSTQEINYSELYFYVSYRFYNGNIIKINAALQASMLLSRYIVNGSWGSPWLWTNIMPFKKFPLSLRFACKFGELGVASWRKDNEFDGGLAFTYKFRLFTLVTSASYRVHSKGRTMLDFSNKFDQAGNEIHFKLEPVRKISNRAQISLFLIGYRSGNKKYRGNTIPDSESFKTALGANFAYRSNGGMILTLGFLADIDGRYDKKGYALIFNAAY